MHETHDPHRGPKLLSWTCGRHRNASCSQLRGTDETGGPEWERMEFYPLDPAMTYLSFWPPGWTEMRPGGLQGKALAPRTRLANPGNPACRGTFGGRRKAVRDRFALQGGTGDFP